MRNLFLIISIIAILIGCSKEDIPALQSIMFQKENIEITIGEEYQCILDLYPSKSEYPKCRWISSREDVASVSFNGLVKTNSVGSSTISAYVNDAISTSCNIKVLPKHVQSFTLDKKLLETYIGDEATLNCEVLPSDATYKDVYWYSTNSDIASVDKNGIVYCKKEGRVDIIGGTTEMEGYTKGIRDTCHIVVKYRRNNLLYEFDVWDNNCPYELEFGERNNIWATTNEREALMGLELSVQQTDKQKRDGLAAEVKTLAATEFVKQMGIHIIPGVLFLGRFDKSNFSQNKFESFLFGTPINHNPISIKGYYNYKHGNSEYINSDGSVNIGKVDKCGIYAVYHGIDKYGSILNANNIFTDKKVIAIAEFEGGNTNENTMSLFEALFIKTGNNGYYSEYGISIILMASSEGLNYEGVIGSKLVVDDLEVVLE